MSTPMPTMSTPAPFHSNTPEGLSIDLTQRSGSDYNLFYAGVGSGCGYIYNRVFTQA